MQKKLHFIIVVMVFIPFAINAQQDIVSGGGDAFGSGGSVSHSVGQVAYHYVTGSSNASISEGVQQPFEVSTLGEDNFPEIILSIAVYPNPTSSFLNLEIQNLELKDIKIQLIDFNGKEIQSDDVVSNLTQIQIEKFPSAIYLLNVFQNNNLLKTFKIIKN